MNKKFVDTRGKDAHKYSCSCAKAAMLLGIAFFWGGGRWEGGDYVKITLTKWGNDFAKKNGEVLWMSCQVLGVFCCCPLYKFIKNRHHQGIHLLMVFYTASLKGWENSKSSFSLHFFSVPWMKSRVFMRGSCSIGRNCASWMFRTTHVFLRSMGCENHLSPIAL